MKGSLLSKQVLYSLLTSWRSQRMSDSLEAKSQQKLLNFSLIFVDQTKSCEPTDKVYLDNIWLERHGHQVYSGRDLGFAPHIKSPHRASHCVEILPIINRVYIRWHFRGAGQVYNIRSITCLHKNEPYRVYLIHLRTWCSVAMTEVGKYCSFCSISYNM